MRTRIRISLVILMISCTQCYSAISSNCSFAEFVEEYFTVYSSTDTTIELCDKNTHKWQINPFDSICYDVQRPIVQGWVPATAYNMQNRYLLRFWKEYENELCLMTSTLFVLCDLAGSILSEVVLDSTSTTYNEDKIQALDSYSKFYVDDARLQWILFKDPTPPDYKNIHCKGTMYKVTSNNQFVISSVTEYDIPNTVSW